MSMTFEKAIKSLAEIFSSDDMWHLRNVLEASESFREKARLIFERLSKSNPSDHGLLIVFKRELYPELCKHKRTFQNDPMDSNYRN